MPVSAISSVAAQSAAGAAGFGGLTADDFLNLLIAELRMQDPMSPMDTQALVQQLSQMAMVAETRQAREGQELGRAVDLIGRTVQWQDATTGQAFSGQVSGVVRDGSVAALVVGSQRLKFEQIVAIS